LVGFQNHNPEATLAPIPHDTIPAVPVASVENANMPTGEPPAIYETSALPPQSPASVKSAPKKKKKRTKKGTAIGSVFLIGGLALIILAFVLGCGVLFYKWYEVPFSIFRIWIYRDFLATLLSFFVPVCVYGGGYLTLAGIGPPLVNALPLVEASLEEPAAASSGGAWRHPAKIVSSMAIKASAAVIFFICITPNLHKRHPMSSFSSAQTLPPCCRYPTESKTRRLQCGRTLSPARRIRNTGSWKPPRDRDSRSGA